MGGQLLHSPRQPVELLCQLPLVESRLQGLIMRNFTQDSAIERVHMLLQLPRQVLQGHLQPPVQMPRLWQVVLPARPCLQVCTHNTHLTSLNAHLHSMS